MSKRQIGEMGWERDLSDCSNHHAGNNTVAATPTKPRALKAAQSCRAVRDFRLDPLGTTPTALLKNIRTSLAAGLPSMFGFSVHSQIPAKGEGTGNIPYPTATDKPESGHNTIVFGYDITRKNGTHLTAYSKSAILGARNGVRKFIADYPCLR